MEDPEWLTQVIAVEGWLNPKGARLLHDAAQKVRDGCIVEIGSYRGRSTVALSAGAPEGVPVFAVEPHETFKGALGGSYGPEDRAAFYETMLRTGAWRNVRLVNLSSEIVTPGWNLPVALLWIDGDHSYDAVRRDVDVWMRHLTPDSALIFDDSRNPDLGPIRVIRELIAEGWETAEDAGRIQALRRRRRRGRG